jgi:hypothetical protein
MANATQGFQNDNRAQLGATRESLWDIITSIRKDETYVTSTSGSVKVGDQVHMWATQAIRTIGDRSQAQGADPTFDNVVTARSTNFTQIISVAYELTGTRIASNAVGGDPWARERNNAMSDWKDFAEYALVRGSLVSGNNSSSAKLKGMKGWASTNLTAQSGISFSEAIFNAYMGNAWSSGINPDTVLVGKSGKQRISGFTAGVTKTVPAEEYEIYGRVDVYDGDFGRQIINKHRFVTDTTVDTNFDFLSYESKYVQIGFLREPHFDEVAKTGDAEREQVIGELTLQVDSEKAVVLGQYHL